MSMQFQANKICPKKIHCLYGFAGALETQTNEKNTSSKLKTSLKEA
jgi:hypothetical protein